VQRVPTFAKGKNVKQSNQEAQLPHR